MPLEIIILLAVAGIGILGSIALLICNVVLSGARHTRSAQAMSTPKDDWLPEPISDGAEGLTMHSRPQEDTQSFQKKEIVFTPLGTMPKGDLLQNNTAVKNAEETVTLYTPPQVDTIPQAEIVLAIGVVRLAVGNAQEVGTRAEQQDAFAITPLEEVAIVHSHGAMAVVCDGMGGLSMGAQAANLCATQFMRNYLSSDNVQGDALLEATYATNRAVCARFAALNATLKAGTTLVAASVLPDGLRFVSVGDSHIYLFRKAKLYQLNRDHNYFSDLMELVNKGEMTLEEAQQHPERAHLTSFIGLPDLELVDSNVEPIPLRAGDRLLLCSDGLFKALSLAEMAQVMQEHSGAGAEDALLDAVMRKERRKQDNVTVVILYCEAA